MAKHNSLSELFTDIADSIRAKTGSTDPITANDFPEAIEAIEAGSGGIAAGIVYDEFHATTSTPTKATIYGECVPSYSFYYSSQLEHVNLDSALKKIGSFVFYECRNLKLTELPAGLLEIGMSAFYFCTTLALSALPAGLVKIENNSFKYCEKNTFTELPIGVTSIGASAFENNSNIAITELPPNLVTIDSQAFANCYKVTVSSIPASVQRINSNAFIRCGLTALTFKGTPTTIANNVFSYCDNLTTINVPWAEGAVANAPWGATNATINYNYTGA